ncbi:MAG: LapA family protein, partial [Phycisphaerae bacterium]
RGLVIVLFLVLLGLVCWDFFSKGQFPISTGMLLFMLLAAVLVLAETFDQISIGHWLSLKRELRAAKGEAESAKRDAIELREQLTQMIVVGIKITQHQLTNVNVSNAVDKSQQPAPAPNAPPLPEVVPPESDAQPTAMQSGVATQGDEPNG